MITARPLTCGSGEPCDGRKPDEASYSKGCYDNELLDEEGDDWIHRVDDGADGHPGDAAKSSR